jgi:hypothetical protein
MPLEDGAALLLELQIPLHVAEAVLEPLAMQHYRPFQRRQVHRHGLPR